MGKRLQPTPNVNAAVEKLRQLVANLRGDSTYNWNNWFASVRFIQREGFGCLRIGGNDSDLFDEALDALCPDQGTPTPLGRSQATRWIDDFLFETVFAKDGFEHALKNASRTLRERIQAKPRPWFIYRPVSRLKIPEDGFQFGRVFFFPVDHPEAEKVRTAFRTDKVPVEKRAREAAALKASVSPPNTPMPAANKMMPIRMA